MAVEKMVPRCPGTDTQRLSLIATEEMERFRTQYFSKPADLEKSFKKICGLSDDAGIGAITIDELTIAMENLGFALSEDKDEAEEEVFEMIGEVDSKGNGEIDLEDFVKLLTFPVLELPYESS